MSLSLWHVIMCHHKYIRIKIIIFKGVLFNIKYEKHNLSEWFLIATLSFYKSKAKQIKINL